MLLGVLPSCRANDRNDGRTLGVRVETVPLLVVPAMTIRIALVHPMPHIPICALEIVLEAHPLDLHVSDFCVQDRKDPLPVLRMAQADFFDNAVRPLS